MALKASSFFCGVVGEEETGESCHHFLDSCSLCMAPLRGKRDIYMYRGNTPFCSKECRDEQIESDEAEERCRRRRRGRGASAAKATAVSASWTVVTG